MKDSHETQSPNGAQRDPGEGRPDESAAEPHGGEAPENDVPQQPPSRRTRGRSDRARIHTRHHGVLSRNVLEILVISGENSRHLRRIEKSLRAELKPVGMLGQMLFDKAWSSYLRCVLIGHTEAALIQGGDTNDSEELPQLKAGDFPTLVWLEPGAPRFKFSPALTKNLETILRYDSHFAREFYRAVGLLVAMQTDGLTGILDCLKK
jgi:hypothetical protein